MKTVEKVLTALFIMCLSMNTVICFCEGNITAGLAWINVWVWFVIALNNRRRAEIYMECCEMMQAAAQDLVRSVRNLLGNHEQPESSTEDTP